MVLVAVLCLAPMVIAVVAILAVTFLGTSASSKFSAVGTSVGDGAIVLPVEQPSPSHHLVIDLP